LDQNDLFDALLQARDPDTGKGLTTEELVAEAGVLIVAGTDTTATSLTSTIFYLFHYPLAFERLIHEIRMAFRDLEDIRIGPQLTSCRYLFACVDEAMRFFPGVGALLSREISKGGLLVDGEMLPEGTDIGVSAYSIHHSEIYYSDRFIFKPES